MLYLLNCDRLFLPSGRCTCNRTKNFAGCIESCQSDMQFFSQFVRLFISDKSWFMNTPTTPFYYCMYPLEAVTHSLDTCPLCSCTAGPLILCASFIYVIQRVWPCALFYTISSILYIHVLHLVWHLYITSVFPLHPLTAKSFNLNFHPLEVVSRWRDPQLQVSKHYSDLTKSRSTLFKSCWLMSHFIFNIFTIWYLMC